MEKISKGNFPPSVENKNIQTIVKEAFLIGHSATNYYLLNYGIKSLTIDLVVSYSGKSSLDDATFYFHKNEFRNDGDDQIIAWKRHVKIHFDEIHFKDSPENKNTLQLIFENGNVVNIKTKQDILNFKWANASVNDFMIFIL